MNIHWPLTLYHDGACPLCAREIALLRKRSTQSRLLLVDIHAASFDAEQQTGRSLATLQARLHAQDASGRWYIGLDATRASWCASGFQLAARLAGWAPLRWILLPGYALFARLRPALQWLPHPDQASHCQAASCISVSTAATSTTETPDCAKRPEPGA